MSSGRVWLIGGTQESRHLAIALTTAGLPVTVTVTTAAARDLYGSEVNTVVSRLQAEQMGNFLQKEAIAVVLDASHPHAAAISQGAIAAAQHHQIPYLRFERPGIALHSPDNRHPVTELDSFETLLAGNYLLGQRVLLTIGYRYLPLFASWQPQATLFTRILPSSVALETALAAGFSRDRIIALQPPVPPLLEQALWHHWQISLVVAKASGQPGGEDTKRRVAATTGTPLILIARPAVAYPAQTSDITAAIKFCAQQLGFTYPNPAEYPEHGYRF